MPLLVFFSSLLVFMSGNFNLSKLLPSHGSTTLSVISASEGQKVADLKFADKALAKCINKSPAVYVADLTQLTCEGEYISDSSGIEQLTELEFLNLKKNKLTNIDLSTLNKLEYIALSDNKLATIDLSTNTRLRRVGLEDNFLTEIDVSHLLELSELRMKDNNLSHLNVANNIELVQLKLSNNNLSSIDISQNVTLQVFWIAGNSLTTLDITHNKDLMSLNIGRNQFTQMDLSKNPKLFQLVIKENLLKELDISNNIEITGLQAQHNQLSSIDLTRHSDLTTLDLSYNQLSSIDISNHEKLSHLTLSGNLIKALDVKGNPRLRQIKIDNNPISCLEVRKTRRQKPKSYITFTGICECDASEGGTVKGLNVDEGRQFYKNKNWSCALAEWEPLAESGNIDAQIQVGKMFARPARTFRDVDKGFYWYEQAASQGSKVAAVALADLYFMNQVIPKKNNNFETAADWYQIAADQGIVSAQFNLGVLYLTGLGVPVNFLYAKKNFKLACAQKYSSACEKLSLIDTSKTSEIKSSENCTLKGYRLVNKGKKWGGPMITYLQVSCDPRQLTSQAKTTQTNQE